MAERSLNDWYFTVNPSLSSTSPKIARNCCSTALGIMLASGNHTRNVRTYALMHRPITQPDLFRIA